jgi:nitroreductase
MLMSKTTNEELKKALEWRYATKVFDKDRSIPEEVWNTLLEALLLTPTSYGLQPYRFVVVEDRGLRSKLREISWNQAQVTDASRYLVFLAAAPFTVEHVDRNMARIAAVRGVSMESLASFRDMVVKNVVEGLDEPSRLTWAAKQAYIALGGLMTAAALLGVDACPLEGFDHAGYDRILGVSGYRTQAALALGYRGEGDKYATLPKVRFAREDLVEIH